MGIPQYNETSEDARPDITDPEHLIARFGRLHVLDDLIRLRAADPVQLPILAYPKPSNDDAISYEYFTGQDLDCMVDQTVSTLMDCGFRPVSPPHISHLSITAAHAISSPARMELWSLFSHCLILTWWLPSSH